MSKTARLSLVIAIIVLISLLIFVSVSGFYSGMERQEIIGRNTFEQSMVQADGSEVHYYATGDERFHYLHDEYGYILMQENGYLVYATEKDGRPIPSNVRFDSGKEKIAPLPKMSYKDIDFESNPDLVYDFPTSSVSTLFQSANSSADATVITNIIIYIKFKDENIAPDETAISRALNGETNSLFDYYQKLSYGSIIVDSISPYANNHIFVYEDTQPRSYYTGYRTNAERLRRERTLLNAAVNASKPYLNVAGYDLDTDNDSYVDAVHFLVSGIPNGWGELLWPHSWDLDDISAGNPATIGGLKVKKYAFNFWGKLTVGLLSHEFGHVLGVPDLYHYNESEEHYAIGDWDLMHLEGKDAPQFMNSHSRNKYLEVLGDGQIQTIDYNGVYSLKPVTVTEKSEVIAYRINSSLRSDEYFMVEYRNNNVSVYDSTLPGSGLIIYRICTRVTGNTNGLKNSATSPDEVYIFRPSVYTSGSEASRSRSNLMKAYLSPDNQYFRSLGQSREHTTKYDSKNIYFTNGDNSGIVISAVSISDDEITFNVSLTGSSVVDEGYFNDKISLNNAQIWNAEFSGVYADMNVTNFDLSKLSGMIVALKDASGEQTALLRLSRSKFAEAYNATQRSFQIRFIVNAKGDAARFPTVFQGTEWLNNNEPKSMHLYVIDADNNLISLTEIPVTVGQMSWETVQMTNIRYTTLIAASRTVTAAVRKDGQAFVSSGKEWLNNQTITDVISLAAGENHIVYTDSALRAYALYNLTLGSPTYTAVSQWRNIIKVAASKDTSFGLDLNGKVVYAGNAAYAPVTNWTGVVDIASGENHFAAVLSNGRVEAIGQDDKKQCTDTDTWTDIAAVACGDTFTAGLKKDGTIVIAGELPNSPNLATWRNIKRITAGNTHIAVIFEDGTVAAAGNSEHGKTNLNSPTAVRDIIGIAAGLYHTVMLREDGELIYRGVNTNSTNNYTNNIIYYNNDYIHAIRIVPPFTEKHLTVGSKYMLKAELYPQNASYKRIVYTSSQPGIVAVSQSGEIEAIAQGTAIITLTHAAKNDITAQITVTVSPAIQTSVMAAAGSNHSVILYSDGTVEAAGENNYGQIDVHGWGGIKFIAAAYDTTAGVTSTGKVKLAGKLASQFNVLSWDNIVFVSLSENTIVAVNANGSVFALGDNTYQQITLATATVGGRVIKSAAVSSSHILLLDSQGAAYAYGNNANGQVSALASKNWKDVVKVAAGNGFSIALRKTGELYYAGKTSFDLSPLGNWTDIIDISISEGHIAGLKADGTVLALGDNAYLQSNTDSLENIALIAAGGKHTLAVSFDGAVGGRGRNSDARLVFNPVGEITKIPLEELTFAQEFFGVQVSKAIKLQMHATPFNATERDITFSTNNSAFATVDANGYVRGVAQGEAQITATYKNKNGATVSVRCTVYVYADTVQEIELLTLPTRRVFSYGETLDLAGASLKVKTTTADKYFVTELTRDMVPDFDTATVGNMAKNITVRLADKEVQYQIFITQNVRSVTINNPEKLKNEYYFGEEISFDDVAVTVSRYGGSSEVIQMEILRESGKLIVLTDTNDLMATQVVLHYKDTYSATIGEDEYTFENYFVLSYDIIVKDIMIGVNAEPSKTTFNYGEEVYGNGEIEIVMASGAIITLPLDRTYEDEEVSITVLGYDPYLLGEQTIRVSVYDKVYGEDRAESAPFCVTVEDTVESVEITSITLNGALVFDANRTVEHNAKIRVNFVGGYSALAGYDDGQSINEYIRPVFSSEANGKDGPFANITMSVLAKNSANETPQVFSTQINVFGLKTITSLEFVDKRTGDIVPFVYRYGEVPALEIKITTSSTVHNVNIDAAALNINPAQLGNQAISFSLLGVSESKTIVFYDYVVDLSVTHAEVETVYDEMFSIELFEHMASGVIRKVTGWGHQGFNAQQLGEQTVTISSSGKQITVKVTVIDVILRITVVTSPKTSYELHEEIDLNLLRIRVNFKSGTSREVTYTGNESSFTWSGYDKDIIREQTVTVRYLTFTMEFTFVVRNKISNIYVDEQRSRNTYMLGENLNITVMCRYENGDEEEIIEYTTTFKNNVVATEYIQISYMGGRYTTAFRVEVVDAFVSIRISQMPSKDKYSYGEVLDLTGGEVTITTQQNRTFVQPLTAFAQYITGNNPTPATKGKQEIALVYPIGNSEIRATFSIHYQEKSTSIMLEAAEEASGVTVNRQNTYVLFDESITYRQLNDSLSSYGIIYIHQSGGYLSSADYDIRIRSFAKIEIRNVLGDKIEEFTIYIKGDCDGNGVFDESDIPIMARYLAQGINGVDIYTDINGDKKFSLLDLTQWIAHLEEAE